jgi:hypothetical protein
MQSLLWTSPSLGSNQQALPSGLSSSTARKARFLKVRDDVPCLPLIGLKLYSPQLAGQPSRPSNMAAHVDTHTACRPLGSSHPTRRGRPCPQYAGMPPLNWQRALTREERLGMARLIRWNQVMATLESGPPSWCRQALELALDAVQQPLMVSMAVSRDSSRFRPAVWGQNKVAAC